MNEKKICHSLIIFLNFKYLKFICILQIYFEFKFKFFFKDKKVCLIEKKTRK